MKHTALILFAILTAAAQTPVDIKLTAAGKTTKLTNGYAYAAKGFFDKKVDDTVIVFADRPLTDAQVRDSFGLQHLAEDGKLSFVQEIVSPKGQIIQFTVGHPSLKMSPAGASTEHHFEGKMDGKTISGKVFTDALQNFFGAKFEYSGTFNLPIQPKK